MCIVDRTEVGSRPNARSSTGRPVERRRLRDRRSSREVDTDRPAAEIDSRPNVVVAAAVRGPGRHRLRRTGPPVPRGTNDRGRRQPESYPARRARGRERRGGHGDRDSEEGGCVAVEVAVAFQKTNAGQESLLEKTNVN